LICDEETTTAPIQRVAGVVSLGHGAANISRALFISTVKTQTVGKETRKVIFIANFHEESGTMDANPYISH